MSTTQILFWFLSILAVLSAVGVVASRNPIYSVLWLIVVFFSISGQYVLMNAQFLAIVNVIVYAGAIMVLFTFVIMLMNLNEHPEIPKNVYLKAAGIIAGMCLLVVLVAALAKSSNMHESLRVGTNVGLIKYLGRTLFNDYVVPFEISSVLFLSAMIGAVVIGRKEKETVA
ncbi:MAG: NADH-quinone oxidoreductase subunit J [Bacteroidota bacterium]|nr:NADH-quinone oxidoreductase subunit J [Bacteroidota bacterium]